MEVPSTLDELRARATRRNAVRALFVTVVVLTVVGATPGSGGGTQGNVEYEVGETVAAPPGNNTTVIANNQAGTNYLTAIGPNGTVTYNGDYLDINNDVDPVPGTEKTVLVVGSDVVSGDVCSSADGCHRNVLMRVNLSTGERELLWNRTTDLQANQVHDVDRIAHDRFLVGDISHDRVFVLNTTTDMESWSWHAQSEFPLTGGGIFPGDWTHLNDVEVLEDGRYMANLRNQDQVVFIDPETGLQENWTLGCEDCYDILYEPHNPDYIPEENGGPAILIADSENNRVVEYQRVDGEWEQSWVWRDPRMQWPRDADRLPNGNTLIADSNGRRVLEVNPEGDIVWSVQVDGVYDVERLGTGDESTGGPSARRANLTSVTIGSQGSARDMSANYGPVDRALLWIKDRIPPSALNGLLFVTPDWFNFRQLVGTGVVLLTLLAWAAVEWRWSPYELTVRRVDPAAGGDGADAEADPASSDDD